MSSKHQRRTDSAESRDRSTADAGTRIDPRNWPDHLQKYRTKRPDDPDARDVQDPHSWDNPDEGRLEKWAPDTTLGWIFAGGFSLILIGVLLYLGPIFAPVMLDPLAIAAWVLLASHGAVWARGRIGGFRKWRDITKHVRYYGDEADVVPVDVVDSNSNRPKVESYRSFSWLAILDRKLLKKDLPYNAENLRSNPAGSNDDPVRDELNSSTATADHDALGEFIVSHTSGVEYDAQATGRDRYLDIPDGLDASVVDDVRTMMRRLRREIKAIEAELEEADLAAEEARDRRKKRLAPEIKQVMSILTELESAVQDPSNKKNGSEASAGLEIQREAAEAVRNGGGDR